MSFHREPVSLDPQTYYVFKPEEDITAYEIAKLLPLLIAACKNSNDPSYEIAKGIKIPSDWEQKVKELDESLRRHFAQHR